MHGELGILDDMRHDVVKSQEVRSQRIQPKKNDISLVFSSFVFGASVGREKVRGRRKKGGAVSLGYQSYPVAFPVAFQANRGRRGQTAK
eukprot:scaffold6302_cov61-Cyclotella_meneghiniana.AAC.11